ncbi:MAG: hypothetical protein KGR19_10375 [Acidobacteria bacterium]|nr:hypothetical protein [Acidobacteriota bacterium]
MEAARPRRPPITEELRHVHRPLSYGSEDLSRRLLDDPFTALIPWIIFSFTVSDFDTAALYAFLSAAVLVSVSAARGIKPRSLELVDFLLFGSLFLIGLLGVSSMNDWLDNHADEVSNLAVTVIAFGSLIVGRPFTQPYTKARLGDAPQSLLDRVDRLDTTIWGLGFLAAFLLGGYGEFVLGEPDNPWTAWILQLAPLVIAFQVTRWLDWRAWANEPGQEAQAPNGFELARDLFFWLIPTGLFAWILDAEPPWLPPALFSMGIAGFSICWVLVLRSDEGEPLWHEGLELVKAKQKPRSTQ